MAETLTPRFGLRQWGDRTDTVSRVEFNDAFRNIEDRGAIDAQGTYAARPAVGVSGRYYYATDKKVIYRDTGTAWVVVGSTVEGFTATSATVSSPAAIIKGIAGQSQDILQIQNSGNTVLASFTSGGGFKAGGVYLAGNANEASALRLSNAAASISALSSNAPALVVRGASGQSANIMELRNSTNAVISRFTQLGEFFTAKASKTTDSDPVSDNEFLTYGALKRLVSDWQIETTTQADYNALSVKDPRTLYVITS